MAQQDTVATGPSFRSRCRTHRLQALGRYARQLIRFTHQSSADPRARTDGTLLAAMVRSGGGVVQIGEINALVRPDSTPTDRAVHSSSDDVFDRIAALSSRAQTWIVDPALGRSEPCSGNSNRRVRSKWVGQDHSASRRGDAASPLQWKRDSSRSGSRDVGGRHSSKPNRTRRT